MLPGSALKVPGGWVPTHFKVSLQLQLRLSWAVTKTLIQEFKTAFCSAAWYEHLKCGSLESFLKPVLCHNIDTAGHSRESEPPHGG